MTDKKIRAITAVVLAAAVLLQVCAVGAKKPPQLNTKLGNVNWRINQVKYRIHLKESQKRTVTGQLTMVEGKLYNAQDRLTSNKIKLLDAQIDLTMRVVQAILESRGMRWQCVTRAVCYLKPGEDASAFWRYCQRQGIAQLPAAVLYNDVCRDELLFEIEVDSVC